jgi:hypothetical protein
MGVWGEEISSYIIHMGLKYMIQWGFPIIHCEGVIKYIPLCSRRSRWSGRVLWQGVLCGWGDAGSEVIPARRGFCVDALPVDICKVSEFGSMVIICGEGVKTKCVRTYLSGYHFGSGLSCDVCCSRNNLMMALLQGRNM